MQFESSKSSGHLAATKLIYSGPCFLKIHPGTLWSLKHLQTWSPNSLQINSSGLLFKDWLSRCCEHVGGLIFSLHPDHYQL